MLFLSKVALEGWFILFFLSKVALEHWLILVFLSKVALEHWLILVILSKVAWEGWLILAFLSDVALALTPLRKSSRTLQILIENPPERFRFSLKILLNAP